MWRRDPRYQISALALLLIPVVLLVASAASGASGSSYLGMPVLLGFFVGFGAHNDVAYDDTAFALHVSSGVPGWADRVGRLVPYGLMWAVAGSVYLVLAGWRSGRWDLLPAVLGVRVVLAAAGWGVSSVTSVLLPYPVPGPADSPFSTPPGSVGSSFLAQSLFLAVVLTIAAPSIGLGLWRLFDGPVWSGWAALGVGVVLGTLSLVVGVIRGGAYLDHNADRVLARLVASR